MRSSGTRAWLSLVVAGVLCVPLLGGCVYSCNCSGSSAVCPT